MLSRVSMTSAGAGIARGVSSGVGEEDEEEAVRKVDPS